MLIPACRYADITRPEQSKQPPVPPKQYHFPAWRSAHRSATSRGFADAEAGDGASGTSTPAMRRTDSAARVTFTSALTGMVMVPDWTARAAAGPAGLN